MTLLALATLPFSNGAFVEYKRDETTNQIPGISLERIP